MNTGTAARQHPSRQGSWLRLAVEFELRQGQSAIRLVHSVERVVAFLALARRPVTRSVVAGSLWPEVPEERANGDLRSALWRLRRAVAIVESREDRLSLAPGVRVDVVDLASLADRLLSHPNGVDLDRVAELAEAPDLLTGWDEEWLVVERERYRELRLRALESAADQLLALGRTAEAMRAAMAAIATEPFRETASRLAIRVHLREGNPAEAARVERAHRQLVLAELGVGPSPLMDELRSSLRRPRN
jgi:DNA-binding SARP family transcriptional activator